ncbi:MAG: dockerin type I domain-containing protein [bacterium]
MRNRVLWCMGAVFAVGAVVSPLHACERGERPRNSQAPVNPWVSSSSDNQGWGLLYPVEGLTDYNNQCTPSLTADGKTIVFTYSEVNGPAMIEPGICMATWNDSTGSWGPPAYTGLQGSRPFISPDGTKIYYAAPHPPDKDIWVSTWTGSGWSEGVMLPPPVNTPFEETEPGLSLDGRRLYFSSDRPGGQGSNDIWVARWNGTFWDSVTNLGPPVNTSFYEGWPRETADRQQLYFGSWDRDLYGWGDLWVSDWTGSGWGEPVNLGSPINTELTACSPFVTWDMTKFYCGSEANEGSYGEEDIWVAELETPIGWTVVDMGGGAHTMNGVAIGPARNDGMNRVYAGNFDGHLYEFTWNGTGWTKSDLGAVGARIDGVAIGPGRDDGLMRLYAADRVLGGYLYELTWNGSGWTKLLVGQGGAEMRLIAVGAGRNDGVNRVYVTNHDDHVYEFTWKGSAWEKQDLGIGGPDMCDIAIADGRNDGTMRVYASNHGPPGPGHVYEFTWNGTDWTKLDLGTGGSLMCGIDVKAGRNDGDNRIYGGNHDFRIYEFTWDGSSWLKAEVGSGGDVTDGAVVGAGRDDGVLRIYGTNFDAHVYEFTWNGSGWTKQDLGSAGTGFILSAVGDGRNDGKQRLYASNMDGHLYEYTYGEGEGHGPDSRFQVPEARASRHLTRAQASGWTNTGELQGAQFVYCLIQASDGPLYAGTYPYGDVFKSIDAGTTWTKTADLPDVDRVYALFQASDSTIYAGTYPEGDVFKTIDGGVNWVPTADLEGATSVRCFLQTTDGTIYAGTAPGVEGPDGGGRVFRTTDGGDRWDLVTLVPEAEEAVLALFQADDGTMYAGGLHPQSIARTADGGSSWTTSPLPHSGDIRCIIQAHDSTLWAAGWGHAKGGHVYRSTDNGATWTETQMVMVGAHQASRHYALVEGPDGAIYTGLQTGPDSVVYKTTDGGQSWTNTGALSGAREALCLLKASDGTIYAGTTPNGDVFKLRVGPRKGDVNNDGEVNVLDVIRVVNIILGLGPPPTEDELWAADFNDDGMVNVLDVVGMVNEILGAGQVDRLFLLEVGR